MTEIVWGAEIAVDGEKPDWLIGVQPCFLKTFEWLEHTKEESPAPAEEWVWSLSDGEPCILAIRLPADHAYYTATSKGFTYWPGGDSAPDDWDGGTTLFRCGELARGEPFWGHRFDTHDIIGYHKRIEPTAPAIAPELVERMVALVRLVDNKYGDLCEIWDEARAILAELETSPVERFKRENPNLSPDELLAKALEGREA